MSLAVAVEGQMSYIPLTSPHPFPHRDNWRRQSSAVDLRHSFSTLMLGGLGRMKFDEPTPYLSFYLKLKNRKQYTLPKKNAHLRVIDYETEEAPRYHAARICPSRVADNRHRGL